MDDLLVQPVKTEDFVNPQLDKTITTPKQREKLNSSFKEFFDAEDAKAASVSSIPSAPAAETEKETSDKAKVEEPTKTEPDVKASEEPKLEPKADADKVATDVKPVLPEPPKAAAISDIDAIEPHPSASEEHKSDFKKLKDATKAFRDTAKLYKAKLIPVLSELGYELKDSPEDVAKVLDEFGNKVRELKSGAMAPEVQTELQTLRELARSVGVLQSEEFTQKYVKPIETSYIDVIREMAKHFNGTPEEIKEKFLDPMEKDYRPHQIPEEWWDTQIGLMKEGTSETVKQKIRQKVANVLLLQEQHDTAANELSKNKESYADWKKKSDEAASKTYQTLVLDEATKILTAMPEIAEVVRPLATEGIKDPAQIEAIVAHNKRAADLDKDFTQLIRDFGTGPRLAARRAMEFVELREVNRNINSSLESLKSELESLKKSSKAELQSKEEEISRLKEEVSKKRKVADAPLKPQAGQAAKPETSKSKLPKDDRASLREAFDKWVL